jgi:hypothetical protein
MVIKARTGDASTEAYLVLYEASRREISATEKSIYPMFIFSTLELFVLTMVNA